MKIQYYTCEDISERKEVEIPKEAIDIQINGFKIEVDEKENTLTIRSCGQIKIYTEASNQITIK